METKDWIALGLLLIAIPAGVTVCSFSRGARELAFFLLVTMTVVTQKMDVNFLSHEWYRGTTRGIEFSFVDIFALSVLGSSLLRRRPGEAVFYWPASLGLMLLFFAHAAGSVALNEPRIFGVLELSKMFRGILVFLAAAMFIRGPRELAILVLGLSCALCFEGALAVKQRWLNGVYRVTGSIEHANSFSMYLCLVTPVLLAAVTSEFPRWLRNFASLAIAAATLSILLTVSRAGMPIFAFVMLGTAALTVSWRITLKKIAIGCLVLLALTGLVAKAWDTLMARYGEATFEEEYLTDVGEGRGYYLRLAKVIMNERPLGVGLNNWSYQVSKTYGARLGTPYEDYDQTSAAQWAAEDADAPSHNFAAPAHNLGALTVGELGVPGLLLFGLLWLRWFQMGAHFVWRRSADPTRRIPIGIAFGVGGAFLQSVTEWTYRQTHILFTLHLLLGALASMYFLSRRTRRQQPLLAIPRSRQTPARMEYEPAGS